MEFLIKNEVFSSSICKIDCPSAKCVGNCPSDSRCGLDLFKSSIERR